MRNNCRTATLGGYIWNRRAYRVRTLKKAFLGKFAKIPVCETRGLTLVACAVDSSKPLGLESYMAESEYPEPIVQNSDWNTIPTFADVVEHHDNEQGREALEAAGVKIS